MGARDWTGTRGRRHVVFGTALSLALAAGCGEDAPGEGSFGPGGLTAGGPTDVTAGTTAGAGTTTADTGTTTTGTTVPTTTSSTGVGSGTSGDPDGTNGGGMGGTTTTLDGGTTLDGAATSDSGAEASDGSTTPQADAASPDEGYGESDCLAGIDGYTETGPFDYESQTFGSVKAWVPDVPAGCKVPVVHLANGTGARCSSYSAILTHLASHGFLATCYEDTNTGQGEQCITALETMYDEYPDLAADKVGSTGHSQGGGATMMCLYRAEEKWGDAKIYAGVAMEPAHGYGDAPSNYGTYYAQIESPSVMFNGSRDTLVSSSWVQRGFDALPSTTEAYYYTAEGASHIPVPTRWTQELAVAFFRWKLLNDRDACLYFKDMPSSSDWSERDVQNPQGC